MKRKKTLAALVTLNAALLALVGVFSASPAPAQLGGGAQYMMIAGSIKGRTNQAVIYILDLRSQQLAALFFNSANNQLDLLDRQALGGGDGGGRR